MDTGILMLAAGRASRFGSDKRLALLPSGEPLLETSLRNALQSGLPVILCLRPSDEQLAETARELGAEVRFCPRAERGMGATLADAIGAADDWQAALIALGDMPAVRPGTYTLVARALHKSPIARPLWRERPGHPVGFSQRFFPRLQRLRGDAGARELLREQGDLITWVEVDDPGVVRDIDTPEDLG